MAKQEFGRTLLKCRRTPHATVGIQVGRPDAVAPYDGTAIFQKGVDPPEEQTLHLSGLGRHVLPLARVVD